MRVVDIADELGMEVEAVAAAAVGRVRLTFQLSGALVRWGISKNSVPEPFTGWVVPWTPNGIQPGNALLRYADPEPVRLALSRGRATVAWVNDAADPARFGELKHVFDLQRDDVCLTASGRETLLRFLGRPDLLTGPAPGMKLPAAAEDLRARVVEALRTTVKCVQDFAASVRTAAVAAGVDALPEARTTDVAQAYDADTLLAEVRTASANAIQIYKRAQAAGAKNLPHLPDGVDGLERANACFGRVVAAACGGKPDTWRKKISKARGL